MLNFANKVISKIDFDEKLLCIANCNLQKFAKSGYHCLAKSISLIKDALLLKGFIYKDSAKTLALSDKNAEVFSGKEVFKAEKGRFASPWINAGNA